MRKVLFIFGLLNDEDVEWMAGAGTLKKLGKNDVLIHQGDRLKQLYILVSGHMEVSIEGLGMVARLGSGEMLGEMSFVDSSPTSAMAKALDDVTLLQLEKGDLEARFIADPGFSGRFFRALAVFLADRLRGTVQCMGYGKGGDLESDEVLEDELDETALDNVSIAGDRFDRMIRTLAGARLGD